MRPHRRHLRRQHAHRAVQRRKGLVKLRHVSADGRLFLNQIDHLTGVGQGQRGVNTANAAADNQHVRVDRHSLHLERLMVRHTPDGRVGEGHRLACRFAPVSVHPGVVLTGVHHLEIKRIQAGRRRRLPEGVLVQQGRARRHHNAVQPVLPDVLLDQLLPGIRTHILVIPRHGHIGQRRRILAHRLDVHHAGNIGSAVANVIADADRFVLFGYNRFHNSFLS